MPSTARMARSAGRIASRQEGQAGVLSWSAFMQQHPRAHLLTGTCDVADRLITGHRTRAALLKRLGSELCRLGHYAVTMLRNSEAGDLAMVAVERREDADRLSQAGEARSAPLICDWI